MSVESSNRETRFKLGKKPFWLSFEESDLGATKVWRVGVCQMPPRARSKHAATPLMELTSRKPLLSIVVDDETYPLFINAWEKKRGRKYQLQGSRTLGSLGRKVTWTGDIGVVDYPDRAQLHFSVNVRIEPRLRQPVRVNLSIPILVPDALVAVSEVAAIREDRASIAWDLESHNAISYVAPPEALVGPIWHEDGYFTSSFSEAIIGARRKVDASISFSIAKTGPDVKNILLNHYASIQRPLLPPAQPWELTLRQTANQAVISHTDKGAYEIQGMERAYFVPPTAVDSSRTHPAEFYAGYPYFHADASLSLLAWHRFSGDDPVARVAKLTARGIAADFPASMSATINEANKGAFWDKLSIAGKPSPVIQTGFDGEAAFSILTNARVARSLFEIHRLSHEDIFESMALNTCRWLLLRQDANGYFNGDRYHASGQWSGGTGLAGVEAIAAFAEAFQATRAEVYIRAAWRIANHVMDEILPHHPAPPVLPKERGAPLDSAVALAAVIRALSMLDAEAANKSLRRAIHLTGNRLLCFPFDRTRDPEFDYDGQWGGLIECALAFFWLHALERKPEQMRMALALTRAVPEHARLGWRSIPLFLTAMLGVANLHKPSIVNFPRSTVKIGWRLFEPDSATRQYVTVESAGDPGLVDHLSLVCRGDDTTLVLVLTDRRVPAISIIKNKRSPVVRDLVSNQLVSGNIPLHRPPFDSDAMYGIYTIGK